MAKRKTLDERAADLKKKLAIVEAKKKVEVAKEAVVKASR